MDKIPARKNGLSSSDAQGLLARYGYNEVNEKRKNYYLLFLRKFYGPVQLLLWAVALLSFYLGHIQDLYIIIALLVLNAVVGFFEEYRADKSIMALKSMLASNARALRDGSWSTIPARLLVPGDMIRIRLGDIVPADAEIIESESLAIDESVISGESFLVEKRPKGSVYQGSTVKRGEATCLVTGTGYHTRYGMVEKLVQVANPKSHLEGMILRLVKYLVISDAAIVSVMFVYGVFVLKFSTAILLPFLLVVFIASIPVALSAAFTVAMALGTAKLSKKSVLVTKLEAIEDTATMKVLCIDKTGTLTKNAITVKKVVPYGQSDETVVRYAAEASRLEDNDPIDNAVLDYSSGMGIKAGNQISFSPFNPSTKRTEAKISGGSSGRAYEVTKGSVLSVMKLVSLSGRERKQVDAEASRLAGNGLRAIAVAVKSGRSGWKLSGLIALYDAPRPEAKRLVGELISLGISVKMITGDSLPVADEIAGEVGIGKNIILMDRRRGSLGSAAIKADGFAAVYPEDKFTIVKALQGMGFVTGMTGDGVNDAPALREAEVGIAVATATDVAKSSAALVLTKNGIGVIVDAVKESRRIFERMLVYTMAKVAKVFQIVGFVAIAFIAFKFIPITTFLLILLIFTNDIANISIATDNTGYSRSPDRWNIRSIMYSSGIFGVMLIAESLVLVPLGFGLFNMTVLQFQTLIFLMFDVTDKLTVFNLRERRAFWKSRPSAALVFSSAIGILAGVVLSYFGILIPRIGLVPILSVFALSIAFMFVNDAVKVAAFTRLGLGQ